LGVGFNCYHQHRFAFIRASALSAPSAVNCLSGRAKYEQGNSMTDQPKPTQDEIAKWTRWFAVECNNQAWELADADERSAADDEQMLRLAHAAALHWSSIGTAVHNMRADVLLAWTHALAECGDEAQAYADRAAAALEKVDSAGDWDRAFMPVAQAFACAGAGDTAGLAAALAKIESARGLLADEGDLKVFDHYRSMIPGGGE